MVKLNAINNEHKSTEEGELKWFDLNTLENEKIVPSDLWMIRKFLDKNLKVPEVTMEEKDGELISFEELS